MFHRPRDEDPASVKGVSTDTKNENTNPQTQQTVENNASIPVTPSNQQKENRAMSQNQAEDRNDHGNEQRQSDIPANMQRMQNPPGAARIPGSYASNYPGYGSSNASGSAQENNLGRKLIVGHGINLSGEIEACDHLIVEGKVEATLKGASVLDIAESGVFYGTVEIEEATIAGRFEGDLTVAGRLTIKSTGSITGAIFYRELAVEAGGTIDGKISPIKDRSDARKPDTKAKAAEPQQQRRKEPTASEEEGLPFMDKTAEAAE